MKNLLTVLVLTMLMLQPTAAAPEIPIDPVWLQDVVLAPPVLEIEESNVCQSGTLMTLSVGSTTSSYDEDTQPMGGCDWLAVCLTTSGSSGQFGVRIDKIDGITEVEETVGYWTIDAGYLGCYNVLTDFPNYFEIGAGNSVKVQMWHYSGSFTAYAQINNEENCCP